MFDGVTIPFSVSDAFSSATSFMSLYKDWILLGLGIALAVLIISILFWNMQKSKRAAAITSLLNSGGVKTIEMDWKVGKSGQLEGREIHGIGRG
ncbi:hypothetical protein [Paenibacillus durus]|uniref:Uncharacterized protein n=1 Tax=Paenibacillus durus TaxID=44251 RepID=A0A089J264_PAEDU|nr:hypothetical protein [Paenibacillus durus]AIQ15274.1 hypothetical protein PDUR_28025 [Paenibacillus durus]